MHQEQNGHEKENGTIIDSATSYDYLEKIFQIPLSLNEIGPAGKAKLIDEALKVTEQMTGAKKVQEGIKENDKTSTENPEGKEGAGSTTGTTGSPTEPHDPAKTNSDLKEKEKKETAKEIKASKQRLVVTAGEVQFMKDISSLVGHSPRAVNRYINIYRILRSHRNLKLSVTPLHDYCAVMILLGIITGLPNESEEFFSSMALETTGSFERFVNKQGDKFKSLKDACRVKFKVPGQPDSTVGRLSIDFMRQKFELVQRFSFRPYDEDEIISASKKDNSLVPDQSNAKAKA
jgi:hypothetical protein